MSEKEVKKPERDYGKILLTSQTGKGKTYSFRNMDESTTGFINVENKPLPFRKAFKYYGKPKTVNGILKNLIDYSENLDITSIVFDSLSAAFDIIEKEMSNNFSGYDIWSNYNKKVAELLDLIKKAPKEVFITSHYEVLNIDKTPEKRVKTVGKRWEGVIEKEFALVLYGESKWKDDKPDYFFRLAGEGLSAKVPPDIFGEGVYTIKNDCKIILDKVVDYYSIPNKD
jgi:hypothetical protein